MILTILRCWLLLPVFLSLPTRLVRYLCFAFLLVGSSVSYAAELYSFVNTGVRIEGGSLPSVSQCNAELKARLGESQGQSFINYGDPVRTDPDSGSVVCSWEGNTNWRTDSGSWIQGSSNFNASAAVEAVPNTCPDRPSEEIWVKETSPFPSQACSSDCVWDLSGPSEFTAPDENGDVFWAFYDAQATGEQCAPSSGSPSSVAPQPDLIDDGSDSGGSDSGGDTGEDTGGDDSGGDGADTGGDTGGDGSDTGGDTGGDGSDTGGDTGGDGSDTGGDTGGSDGSDGADGADGSDGADSPVGEWSGAACASENSPACSGDPVQCAIALESWKANCKGAEAAAGVDDFMDSETLGTGKLGDDDLVIGQNTEQDLTDTFTDWDKVDSGYSAECPDPRVLELGIGGTQEVKFDAFCEFADEINPFVIFMFTFLGSAAIGRTLIA